MPKVRVRLGTKYPKTITVPKIDGIMESVSGQSIMLFGSEIKGYRWFYAIGHIKRIEHFEKYDLVYARFGGGEYLSVCVVYETNARRQLLTCKLGHYAQFYGVSDYIKYEYNGKTKKRHRYYLKAINGWYVPQLIEIKKKNLQLDRPKERIMSEEENKSMLTFIDDIKNMLD